LTRIFHRSALNITNTQDYMQNTNKRKLEKVSYSTVLQ